MKEIKPFITILAIAVTVITLGAYHAIHKENAVLKNDRDMWKDIAWHFLLYKTNSSRLEFWEWQAPPFAWEPTNFWERFVGTNLAFGKIVITTNKSPHYTDYSKYLHRAPKDQERRMEMDDTNRQWFRTMNEALEAQRNPNHATNAFFVDPFACPKFNGVCELEIYMVGMTAKRACIYCGASYEN